MWSEEVSDFLKASFGENQADGFDRFLPAVRYSE
ncbi:hypothetical protein OROGR_024877 [Orobanche gracilis]